MELTVVADPRPGISGLAPGELEAWFIERGQPAYRARQLADAVWPGHATSAADARRLPEAVGPVNATPAADARTLPAPFRDELDAAFRFDTVADTELRLSDGGLTEKALHRLADGALVESVLMHYPARGAQRERHTLCISSQAGCAVGCPFCATGELGVTPDPETPR